MKRLLSKKGITLVEIIVVIAIIAIMTAIVVPLLSNTSSYEKEALENARAFYSNVQQVLIEEKFKGTVLNSGSETKNAKYTLIYAEVKEDSGDPSSRIRISVAYLKDETKVTNEFPGFKITGFDTLNEITTSSTLNEFSNSLKKILAASDYKCFYYAVIDDSYRVASTYFSRYAAYDALSGNKFSKDYRVSYKDEEFIVGAYPYFLSEKDKTFFRDPNEVHSSVVSNKK